MAASARESPSGKDSVASQANRCKTAFSMKSPSSHCGSDPRSIGTSACMYSALSQLNHVVEKIPKLPVHLCRLRRCCPDSTELMLKNS